MSWWDNTLSLRCDKIIEEVVQWRSYVLFFPQDLYILLSENWKEMNITKNYGDENHNAVVPNTEYDTSKQRQDMEYFN